MDPPQPPDADALMLCQIPGMHAALLRRLLERWGSAEAVLRAPSAELRALGVPPATVARVLAAPRQRAAALAGLRSLDRMNIRVLPLPDPAYPRRLHELPDPPLLLYIQGRWPAPAPLVALLATELLPEQSAVPAAFLAALANLGVACGAEHNLVELLPPRPGIVVLPFGLLLARSRIPDELQNAVAGGSSTLISVVAVNAKPTAAATATATQVLIALADGLIALDPQVLTPANLRPEVHRWTLAEEHDGLVRLRPGDAGARTVARALGVHGSTSGSVAQERLW